MNRRGISPLIATVLIIGFTVALASIIMTWGTEFTKRMQASTEETSNLQIICATDVIFDIKSVTKSGDDYNILISNDGKEPIKKWKIRLYETASLVESQDSSTGIEAFGIKQITVNTTLTGIRKVEAIPIIKENVVCAQNVASYGNTEGEFIT